MVEGVQIDGAHLTSTAPNLLFIFKNDAIPSAVTAQQCCQEELIPDVKDYPNYKRWKIAAEPHGV